ncbi:MAG: NADPH-dependent FMN reductase [Euryarchaeota archaeon]|nr:NADPH-dependent FMN reductase [Euryarchaeota archaeon]|tara:strand:+ start:261 stop:851 length:591 start_codon:yes stop_codon:yes gene_type:complete
MNPYIQGPLRIGITMGDDRIKILGLAGEYRSSSKSGMLVNAALEMAEAKGADVVFWDLAEKPLPLVGEEGCWAHPNVKEFQSLLESCDAFFLSSPEYHGTMSGVMKNTMDWMYDKHVGGKVFGLMSTLGGVTNSNTLNHMRIALRWLHAWPVPEQLAIGHVKEAFDEDGSLVDESLQERLSNLVEAVLSASKKMSA